MMPEFLKIRVPVPMWLIVLVIVVQIPGAVRTTAWLIGKIN